MTEHGLADKESTNNTAKFFISLSKASNYDMTLMFINDSEKEKILEIRSKLDKHGDKNVKASFNSIYGEL